MLVAILNGDRIEAFNADRGAEYFCPKCENTVILKKGSKVIHHFAHHPQVNCAYAKGETLAHLAAKTVFLDEFRRRGLRTEAEYEIQSLPGDRRADVVVWSPKGSQYAIELQHTPIGVEEIEKRTFSYEAAEVIAIWLPFLRMDLQNDPRIMGNNEDSSVHISRYMVRPMEKWAFEYYGKRLWLYDPALLSLWSGNLLTNYSWRKGADWYDSDGNFCVSEGGMFPTTRWKDLSLEGPFALSDVRFSKRRDSRSTGKIAMRFPRIRGVLSTSPEPSATR